MKKTRSQRTLIGRNINAFYWLIVERTKLQRRTQPQRYTAPPTLIPRYLGSICGKSCVSTVGRLLSARGCVIFHLSLETCWSWWGSFSHVHFWNRKMEILYLILSLLLRGFGAEGKQVSFFILYVTLFTIPACTFFIYKVKAAIAKASVESCSK